MKEKSEGAKKQRFVMLSGKTRYYGFRNTKRLAALRRFNGLFVLLGVLSFFVLAFAVGTFALWFVLFLITFSTIKKYNSHWFKFIGNVLSIGAIMLVASVVLRVLVELMYSRAEATELKTQPEGADKYLKVRRAAFKIELVNLALIAIVVGLGALAYYTGIGNNAQTIIFAAVSIVAFIASRMFLQKTYTKVRGEIIEIKEERKEWKNK